MDALLTAFVAAFLAAWGDKTQLAVASLSARTGRPGAVLLGLIVAALASNVVAALAGALLAPTITIRALSLLVAVALLFAGIAGLVRREAPRDEPIRLPAVIAATILCLATEIGERTQFLTFAFAGRFDSAPLAAAGATAGLVAACLPAALLAGDFGKKMPLRWIRLPVAALFLIGGFIVGVQALGLV